LQQALTRAPSHRWACHACVALARLAAIANQSHEALRLSQQAVDQFPRAECRAEIWLNRGKLLLTSGDRDEALRAFYLAVDSVDSHPLKPIGYLYVGRLHLENGDSDKAIPALMRALALAEKTPLEPAAACMLSSAFLLDRNPHGANAILMKRRNLLSGGPLSDQAAMLSALARFDGAVEPDRRRHEAAGLVESLAHVQPGAMFGGHWWCLVVDGYRKTGMTHEADRLRDECLRRTPHFPLRDQLLLSAIESRVRSASEPRADDALRVFANLQTVGVRDDVRLLDARTAYRNGLHDAALERCEKLVRDAAASDEARREALRLMGRIYQGREDYKSAVSCYAGMLPVRPTPIDRLGLHPGAGGTP
jgi:tetratricopeptide (TPR) repeat protein